MTQCSKTTAYSAILQTVSLFCFPHYSFISAVPVVGNRASRMLCCLADSFFSHQMHSKAADFIRQIDGIQGAVRLIFRRLHVECEAPGFQFFYGGSNIGRADGDVAVFAQLRRLHQLHVFACEYGAVSLPDGQAKQGFKQGNTLSCLFGIGTVDAHMGKSIFDHNQSPSEIRCGLRRTSGRLLPRLSPRRGRLWGRRRRG